MSQTSTKIHGSDRNHRNLEREADGREKELIGAHAIHFHKRWILLENQAFQEMKRKWGA
jgi:hypothetical protein